MAARKIVKALLGRPPILVGVQKRLADEALQLQRTESGGLFLGDITGEGGHVVHPQMQEQEHSFQDHHTDGTMTGASQRHFIAPRPSLRRQRSGYVTGAGHRKTTEQKRKIKQWKRHQEHRAWRSSQEKWDPVEVVACVCCSAALFAFVTLFRERGAFFV